MENKQYYMLPVQYRDATLQPLQWCDGISYSRLHCLPLQQGFVQQLVELLFVLAGIDNSLSQVSQTQSPPRVRKRRIHHLGTKGREGGVDVLESVNQLFFRQDFKCFSFADCW